MTKKQSYAKYYEEHKDELKAKMRQRDAERRQKIKEQCATDANALAQERERMRAKYHTNTSNKVKKALMEMLECVNVNEVVKTMVRNFLENNTYHGLTLKWCADLKKVGWINNKDAEGKAEDDFRDKHGLNHSDSEGADEGNSGGQESEGEDSEVEGRAAEV